jgi:SagB-type dehydrogenase family enzyme
MESMDPFRKFLKTTGWKEWFQAETDQRRQVPPPPVQEPVPQGAPLFDLVPPDKLTIGTMPLIQAIAGRKSRRVYTEEALTLEELSFLLWATQGVREVLAEGRSTRRTVPSGGARHPFETYLALFRVDGLKPGLYRYLPLQHKVCRVRSDPELSQKIIEACLDVAFCGKSAVTFVWTAVPYRTEWRYVHMSHKIVALDAGHVCQNLYLAAEAIGAGVCAVDAYSQESMDRVLGVDGKDEFAVYVATLGKVAR